jgi:hypothetical protein
LLSIFLLYRDLNPDPSFNSLILLTLSLDQLSSHDLYLSFNYKKITKTDLIYLFIYFIVVYVNAEDVVDHEPLKHGSSN